MKLWNQQSIKKSINELLTVRNGSKDITVRVVGTDWLERKEPWDSSSQGFSLRFASSSHNWWKCGVELEVGLGRTSLLRLLRGRRSLQEGTSGRWGHRGVGALGGDPNIGSHLYASWALQIQKIKIAVELTILHHYFLKPTYLDNGFIRKRSSL